MEDLLEFLARALVDEPDASRSSRFEEDDGTLVLELHVAEDDVGKVIGRGGRTVNALRTVMRAVGGQAGPARARRRRRLTTGAAVPAGRVGRPHGLDGSFYVERRAHPLHRGHAS